MRITNHKSPITNNKSPIIGILSVLLLLLTSQTVYAQETTQTALGEVSDFAQFISLVWSYGSQVIIGLAVFFIILGAFFYTASGGAQERIDQGKQMIFGSLIAIVIVIFSGVLIRTLHRPSEGTAGNLADVPTVIGNASNILVGTIGAFAVLMMVYSGFLYITARGDTSKIDKAHASLKYAVIGLIVGVLAYGIVGALVNYFI